MDCSNCGGAVSSGARFCSNCGAALGAGDAALAGTGERRQLAVLFCDLVDSTLLSEQLDAEEFGDLVLEYQNAAAAAVGELGGIVGNYLGDGVLAWFGWPVAHEDDAARSAEAGLALIEIVERLDAGSAARLGVRLRARVGIHVGPAVVGDLAGPGRRDTPAFGQTLNVAARLEGFAEPGSVVVSETARRLIGSRFATRELGTPRLKGVSEQFAVHVVERVTDAGEAAAVAADVPLVDRAAELEALRSAWREARGGRGRTVVIAGEPGVGKSRLVAALVGEATVEDGRALAAACTPLTANTAFAPLARAVRRSLAIDGADPPSRQRAALRAALRGTRAPVVLLEQLLGVAEDPDGGATAEALRHGLIEGTIDWLHEIAAGQPLVLVVEDLHWADASTLELLGLLHERSARAALLLVLTRRLEGDVPLAGDRVVGVALEPLAAADARRLARVHADLHGLDAERAEAMADRADGIPLFVEQLVAAASEVGDVSEIPSSLQGSLVARLDRLGAAKETAQIAAVVGRSFPVDVLLAVAEAPEADVLSALDRLAAARLVEARAGGATRIYQFRHALIRDAAYDTLLRRRRRELHQRVARVLEERFPDRAAAEPELLGHHLAEGGEHLRAAACFDLAGRRAGRSAALAEAAAHYGRGLDLLERVPDGPKRLAVERSLLIMLGNALMGLYGIGADTTGEVWRRAVGVSERGSDREELTSALNGLAVYELDRGELERAVGLGERILEIGEEIDSRIARLRGHGTIGIARYFLGEGANGLEHLRASLAAYRPSDFQLVTYGLGHDQGVAAHGVAAEALAWLGRLDEALDEAEAGIDLAGRIGSVLGMAMGRHFGAVVHHLRREPEQALAAARANIELCQQMRFSWWEGLGHMLAGTQRTLLGDAGGVDELNDGLALLGAVQSRSGLSFGLSMLAEAQRASGDAEVALAAVEGALAAQPPFRQHHYDAQLLRQRAELLLELERAGARREAERLLREAIEVAEAQGAVLFGVRAAVSLARLLADDGRHPEAVAALASWPDRIQAASNPPDAREARRLLAALSAEGAIHGEAR